jgi:hypothetical protein
MMLAVRARIASALSIFPNLRPLIIHWTSVLVPKLPRGHFSKNFGINFARVVDPPAQQPTSNNITVKGEMPREEKLKRSHISHKKEAAGHPRHPNNTNHGIER